jgi:hypothetical protein
MDPISRYRWLTKATRVIFLATITAFGFALFVFPTRHFQALLGTAATKLMKYESYFVFLTALCVVIAYALTRGAVPPNKRTPSVGAPPKRISRRRIFLQAILSVLILVRTGFQITAPFDYDEQVHASQLSHARASEIAHPLQNTSFHLLATLTSFVSTKLFGVNKIAVRLPALGFAALWLLSLNLFTLELAGPWAAGLLLCHCLSNELVIWYLHSMRGYVSMICLAFLPFWIFYRFVKVGVPRHRTATLLALALSFPLPLFTHAFGGFFCLLLLAAFFLWMGIEGNSLSYSQWQFAWKLSWVALAWVPLLGFVLLKQFVGTDSEQQVLFVTGASASAWHACLIKLFGLARLWWLKLALTLTVVVLLSEIRLGWRRDLGFLSLFLILALVFFEGTSASLHTTLEGRFLLAFLPVFLLWIGEAVDRIPAPFSRMATYMVAAACFLWAPAQNGPAIYNEITLQIDTYQHFVETARRLSGNLPGRCYTFSGDKSEVEWAENFYFFSEEPTQESCSARYHLAFGHSAPLWHPTEGFRLIFQDDAGRALWVIPPAHPTDNKMALLEP